MAFEVLMPQLGLTMEEGTVSQWVKHEGDAVKTGDFAAIQARAKAFTDAIAQWEAAKCS